MQMFVPFVVEEKQGELIDQGYSLFQETSKRFSPRTMRRLHWWDGMSEDEWFMIYRDSYASRLVLISTFAVPLVGSLTSKQFLGDLRDGQIVDAFRNTDLARQVFLPFTLMRTYFLCFLRN